MTLFIGVCELTPPSLALCFYTAAIGDVSTLLVATLSTITAPQGLRSRMNLLYLQLIIFVLLPYLYMSVFTADKQYFVADTAA